MTIWHFRDKCLVEKDKKEQKNTLYDYFQLF